MRRDWKKQELCKILAFADRYFSERDAHNRHLFYTSPDGHLHAVLSPLGQTFKAALDYETSHGREFLTAAKRALWRTLKAEQLNTGLYGVSDEYDEVELLTYLDTTTT